MNVHIMSDLDLDEIDEERLVSAQTMASMRNYENTADSESRVRRTPIARIVQLHNSYKTGTKASAYCNDELFSPLL